MIVVCRSKDLNHVHEGKRVAVGDKFPVKAIPEGWLGLVEEVSSAKAEERPMVVNPKEPEGTDDLRQKYKEIAGRPPHYTWDAEKISQKIAELGGTDG